MHAGSILINECEILKQPLPENKINADDLSFVRQLNCKVIMRLQQLNNEAIADELGLPDVAGQNNRKIQHHQNFLDSVRGMFTEGRKLYAGAGFREKNHIQLCTMNPNSIVGYFDPRKKNSCL